MRHLLSSSDPLGLLSSLLPTRRLLQLQQLRRAESEPEPGAAIISECQGWEKAARQQDQQQELLLGFH